MKHKKLIIFIKIIEIVYKFNDKNLIIFIASFSIINTCLYSYISGCELNCHSSLYLLYFNNTYETC